MAAHAEISGAGAANSGRREVEWQLATRDLGPVRQWLSEHNAVDGFTIEPRSAQTIYDTYLDTEDRRVHQAGFALRLRDLPGRAEATLKDLAPESSGHFQGLKTRREFNEPLASAEQDAFARSSGPVSARVHAVTGGRPLKPLFRVRTQRQPFAVLGGEGQEAGEITLDETVVASADGHSKARLQRVEVEALSDDPQPLEGLVEQLRTACALEPAADSKYAIGLQSVGLTASVSPELGPTLIDPAMTVGEIARANLRRNLSQWLRCEPAARLGEDQERLHDLRVAGRRLDVNLGLFEDYLPRSLTRLRLRWKALLRALGEVRDIDVQLAELERFTDDPSRLLGPVRTRLEVERRRARARMLRMLDRASTQALVRRLHAELSKPDRVRVGRNNPPAVQVAPLLLRRYHKNFRKAADAARDYPAAEKYHEMRRRAKRLRYAIESFEGFYGEAASDFLRALQRLQDRLGMHQDAQIAAQPLQVMLGARRRKLSAETAFLMGVFTERQRMTAAEMRQRFPKAYRRVRGRRWKALRRAMTRQ
jgi:triphosphatase